MSDHVPALGRRERQPHPPQLGETDTSRSRPWREVALELQTDPSRGLDAREAERRLLEHGPNATPETRSSAVVRFLRRFTGLTAWMLEGTAALAYALGKRADALVIGLLVILNALLGFLQEERASRAVEALKSRLRVTARVRRGGAWIAAPGAALVPGDVVRVRGGDVVPADLTLVEGRVEVDEAALTGESAARSRAVDAAVFSGAVVRRGEATGIVVQTGTRTLFGRTAELVQLARPQLHAEALIARLVRALLAMVAALLLVAVVVAAARGARLVDILPLLLVMLVSAVPVALPAMLTVTMALGSTELVRRGALVTRLSASEDAARMDVLCVDKTGTMTFNRLSVAEIVPALGLTADEVLRWAAWGAEEANQDPIDAALIAAARERGLLGEPIERVAFLPFDPATRRTEATLKHRGETVRVMKGAVVVVQSACEAGGAPGEGLDAAVASLAGRGYRTLAVARAAEGGGYRWMGLVALHDPPRPDAARLVAELRRLGVTVKMLTGDSLAVAREIASSVGIGPRVTSTSALRRAAAGHPEAAFDIAEQSDGFAEIYPEDKYLVVRALQSRGHVVGMTGDGVNDAPALRQAEVGVAVSNATDVAKGAASVVLTTEDLAGIVDVVRVGRMIHQRIETWILNKVAKTFQSVVLLVAAFLVSGRFLVSTFGMVLLLFVVDFVTLALATDVEPGTARPSSWNVARLARTGMAIGALSVLESLGLLALAWRPFRLGEGAGALNTFGFELLFFSSLLTIFVVRTRGRLWRSRPSRPLALTAGIDAAVVAGLATIGLPGLAAIPFAWTAAVAGYTALFALLVNDSVKVALLRRGSSAPADG